MKRLKLNFFVPITLTIITLMSVSWVALFNKLDQPKANEKIQIFIASNAYRDELSTNLAAGLKDVGVKSVSLKAVSQDSSLFYTMLSTVGVLDSDLLILPYTILKGIGEMGEFVPLERDTLRTYNIDTSDHELWTHDSKNYALKIYDASSKTNYLDTYFLLSDSEDYYVALNKNTCNALAHPNNDKTSSDRAFYALNVLLSNKTYL